MPNVILLGTLDTKGEEFGYIRDLLAAAGIDATIIDCGVIGTPKIAAEIGREEVAVAGGGILAELIATGHRGGAIRTMAAGAEAIISNLYELGKVEGALSLGGTGGTSIASRAFRALPLGVPKIIVTTAAGTGASAYVGESDLVLFPSVVDIAGLNRISEKIFANAAAAMVGMVQAPTVTTDANKPMIAASMFGVTTDCVTKGRKLLENDGYEVTTFHMVGSGGRTLEALVSGGMLAGVLDITTTELADELVGGIFSAGPCRLTANGPDPVPRVVSVGALDMVNLGAMETVPPKFADRNLLVHNPEVTLMRTTPAECAELGKRLAERVATLEGPVAVILPLRGISAVSTEGGPFHDPAADAVLFDAVRAHLDGTSVRLIELDTHINDSEFARAAVLTLEALITDAQQTINART